MSSKRTSTGRGINTRDVARMVGLSRTAVSYVLNGRQEVAIPETTRAKVLAAGIEVIRRRGLRVPQDLAVIGFNDSILAEYLYLTAVRLSGRDRGRLAIERLLARMENPHLPPEGIIVPTQLVVRESCGAG